MAYLTHINWFVNINHKFPFWMNLWDLKYIDLA